MTLPMTQYARAVSRGREEHSEAGSEIHDGRLRRRVKELEATLTRLEQDVKGSEARRTAFPERRVLAHHPPFEPRQRRERMVQDDATSVTSAVSWAAGLGDLMRLSTPARRRAAGQQEFSGSQTPSQAGELAQETRSAQDEPAAGCWQFTQEGSWAGSQAGSQSSNTPAGGEHSPTARAIQLRWMAMASSEEEGEDDSGDDDALNPDSGRRSERCARSAVCALPAD